MPECSTHSLDTSTTYVVEGVLLCERPTGSLAVSTQSHRFRVLCTKRLHNLCPQHTTGTHLGNLHKVVHTDSPEETETRSKSIHIHTRIDTCAEVLHTIGEGVCQLDVGSGTCLLHVVTGDRNRVELRHLLRGVLKDVGDNLHRELRRIDIRITHHELFKNIVLDSTCHLFEFGTLLQTGVDIERQNRQYGTVHRHRNGHLIQRNTGEEHLHILKRADTYTCFSHIAHNTHIISVIATVCRQVEGYRQTFLTAGEVTTIERVGFLCSGKTCVLTDRPRTQRIHRTIRTTQERRNTRHIVQMLHTFQVLFGIDWLNVNQFRRLPIGFIGSFYMRNRNLVDIYFTKIRFHNLYG